MYNIDERNNSISKVNNNPNYNHEAFLGQEEEEFDNLTLEESQRRLW